MKSALSLIFKFFYYLKTSKPFTWIWVVAAFFMGVFVSLRNFNLPWKSIDKIWAPMFVFLLLSAGSQMFNAYFDIEVDKATKPERPLPSGKISKKGVLFVSLILKLVALILAYSLSRTIFFFAVIGFILSVLYSIPQVKLKRNWFLAALSLAISFTMMPIFAGFISFRPINNEILFIAFLFGLITFGGTPIKDFDSIEERKFGIRTLPVVYGPKNAARILVMVNGVSFLILLSFFPRLLPFLVLPLVLMSVTAHWLLKNPLKYGKKIYYIDGFLFAATEIIFAIGYIYVLFS